MLQSKSQAPASLISIEDVQVLTSTAARTKAAAAAAPASEEARIVETLKPIYKAFCRFEDVIKAWNEQEASILNHEDMSVRQR
jgi:predicted lipid-binding transport protein (Tim44 family)